MPSECPNCGRAITQAAAFCPYCGAHTGNLQKEAAAVAAELAGLGATEAYVSPDVLGEFTEKFLAAADAVARDYGGVITREDATAVTIAFPTHVDSPATKAASCAVALRNATRDLIATTLKDMGPAIYLRAGVDALEGPAELLGEAASPRNGAQRLRNKAGKWAILAGENVYAMTEGDFRYSTVGFYQARSGKPAVKIYQLTEDRRYPSTAPPRRTKPSAPIPGFEEKAEKTLSSVLADRKKRTVAVTGPPGGGKTGAMETAARIAREKGFEIYAHTCLPRFRYRPFSLWATIWRKAFAQLAPAANAEDAPAEALKKLDPGYEIWTPVFLSIMGRSSDVGDCVAEAPPDLRRRRVEELGLEAICRAAEQRPAVILVDDLGFADASSQALLGSLLSRGTETPLAVFFSCASPEHSLIRSADLAFAAEPLSEDGGLLMAESFSAESDPESLAAILAASGGNPGLWEQIWLLAQEKADINVRALAEEALDSAAVVARRLRDYEKPWLTAVAALATIGIPLSYDDVSALAAEALGQAGATLESWRYKTYKLGLLRPALAGADERRVVPPHLAAAFLAAAAPKPEDKREAANIAARFVAVHRPEEYSVRATLELDAGNLETAYENARASVARARWLGSPHTAVDQLTAIIREFEKAQTPGVQERARLSRLLVERAEAFQEAGLVAAALSDLDKVEPDDDRLEAHKLYTQGRVYLLRDYYDESEQYFIQSLQKAVRSRDEALIADVEIALAELQLAKGDTSKAVYELEKSLKGNRAKDVRAYRLLGDLRYRTGDVAAALKAAEEGLALAEAAGKPITAAEMGLAFAPVFFECGRLVQARKLLQAGRSVFGLMGDKPRECESFLAESRFDLLTDGVAAGERGFTAALSFAENSGLDACAGRTYLGLAVAKLLAGDIAAYDRLIVRSRELADEGAEFPRADIKMAEATAAYYADGDYDAAYALSYAAAEEYHNAGSGPSCGEACLSAARAAIARGELQSCREIVGRPELERRARGSKVFAAYYHSTAGALFGAEGDAGRASKYLRAAAAGARELGLWPVNAEAYLDLAALADDEADRESYRRRAVWLLGSKGAHLLAERAAALAGAQ
jgi:class 3 adenylate cyclase